MLVYRLASKRHSKDLTGTGAAMSGGRWNKVGTPVLYTGSTKEIALLELIVHTPQQIIPLVDILTINIPDDSITIVGAHVLPDNWTEYPAPSILSEIGENWVNEGKTIALRVPSCIIHDSHNYVLNCRHPDYNALVSLVHISTFVFDSRLRKEF